MTNGHSDLGGFIAGALPDDMLHVDLTHGELTVTVNRSAIVRVLTFLRDDSNCRFEQLLDVCGC